MQPTTHTQHKKLNQQPFYLESGESLPFVQVAYEIYGTLNADKSNAILVTHAFSGDATAAGSYDNNENFGWWDKIIGEGKAIDTKKFCVICTNTLGGCQGTTGPIFINPEIGTHYGMSFPNISIKDMVNVQKAFLEQLGITQLASVIGGSMGGMQALEWGASYPQFVQSVIPIATAMKHSPQQIAFNEVARKAITLDPNWNKGNYYDATKPELGLSIARMIGHITYMSDKSMEYKFSRRQKEGSFEVENYLQYQGDNFVKRFDANSYLYITKAMDYFDISDRLFVNDNLAKIKFLVVAFSSDWLYPAYQSVDIVKKLHQRYVPVTFCKINSSYGHDAFLLETSELTKLIKPFLEAIIGISGEIIADSCSIG
ncbi:MAG: homoserine O-acetyltransferase [bacterium]|nr:homoserine O-acetyltransferase [bacterium]